MIKSLRIENFKSIKALELDLKRVNLFIGEPNTGKSNILEALGLLSHLCYNRGLGSFVRFRIMTDIFYDHILDNNITIAFDQQMLKIAFKDGIFRGVYSNGKVGQWQEIFSSGYDGAGSRSLHKDFEQFKFYRFEVKENFPSRDSSFLHPPDGDNLLAVIFSNKKMRTLSKEIFNHFGLRLVFRLEENRIEVQKQLEDIVTAFPYSLASDTLQRLVFHLTAIYSNQRSILAFEEPESHAFPYYTKYLGEIIALNKNENQYFISTHNPYFLRSMLEKTPKPEIAVFSTHLENHQTRVKALTEAEMKVVLEKDIDLFFDLERFLVSTEQP